MTRFETDVPPGGAAAARANLSVDMGGRQTVERHIGAGASFLPAGYANPNYIAFNSPGGDAAPRTQVAKAGDDTGSPLDRVKAGLRDSPNPIGDVANTLNSVGNLASFRAVTNGDHSHHVSVRLYHSNVSPPPIGMDQGRHHPGVGYTDLNIEADVRRNGNGLTIANIEGMHSLVHSDRLLPRRQERLGPRTRVANTHQIDIGTDQNGHGYMTVDSGVELPMLRREKQNVSTLREQNLPAGAVRDLLANPQALNETLRAATLFRPDSFREYTVSQPRQGQFEISTTAQTARDVRINQLIPNGNGATLESLHLDPQVKATLSAQTKDGQPSVSLENVSGITFNINTNAKPPFDKLIPPKISIAPKNLTLHNVDGKPVVSYELENPPGSGNMMKGDIPLSKLLEAQKVSKEKPSDKAAKPQDAAPKTQDEWVQKYIVGRGGYTADHYDDAYKAAQAANKPLVLVLDRNNDPKTLEATAAGVARGDAIYVYANVNKLGAENWMSGYAQRNMTGQHEGALFVMTNLPSGSDQGNSYFTNGLNANDVQWVVNHRRYQR